jgi:formylglycine-generating enzyme required for sulfatase activity
VEKVSWNNVQDFLQKLNERSGMKFRLPTEAEWEYAARAGTTGPFSFQDKISADKVNYGGSSTYGVSSKGKFREKTVPVGSLPANPWGLHEVHGNVWEWTCSAYDKNYGGSEEKCAGRNDSGLRVLRGGSWNNRPRGVRSANRFRYEPDTRSDYIGFRLAQD